MMDEKAAPIQHITYNSSKYEHFNNSDEEEEAQKASRIPSAEHAADR